jgi:hypothetical protein
MGRIVPFVSHGKVIALCGKELFALADFGGLITTLLINTV